MFGLRRLIGKVLCERNEVNLHSDILVSFPSADGIRRRIEEYCGASRGNPDVKHAELADAVCAYLRDYRSYIRT